MERESLDPLVLLYSLFPEADSITERWHCLLKIQVLQQLRVKILQCWNTVLQNTIHVKPPIYGPVSSRAIKLGIKGWKNWSFTSALPDVVFPRHNLALCSHQDSKNVNTLGAQTKDKGGASKPDPLKCWPRVKEISSSGGGGRCSSVMLCVAAATVPCSLY